MTIGIDISQLAYPKTGVSNYLYHLVDSMLKADKKNQYVLFYSSLRKKVPDLVLSLQSQYTNVTIKKFKFPPTFLDMLWNRLHVVPIEKFIGKVDIFITSDWTEPPARKAQKATIIYDLIVYKYPKETALIIQDVQKRKLKWVKKESSAIFAISQSTKNDIHEILGIEEEKVRVIYPGMTK